MLGENAVQGKQNGRKGRLKKGSWKHRRAAEGSVLQGGDGARWWAKAEQAWPEGANAAKACWLLLLQKKKWEWLKRAQGKQAQG